MSQIPVPQDKCVVIIGAGPAGLTAAYQLTLRGVRSTVIEQDTVVGGLSRTVHHKGFHFDIGGHRFYTKVAAVQSMWRSILGDDFLSRKRLSRIFYRGKLFQYPLKPFDALRGLGAFESVRVLLSYLRVKLSPIPQDSTFETFVSNRFGRRLFEIFFRSYTEKVWGMPCDQISATWARQRIKGLSIKTAIREALWKSRSDVIKSLIETFDYPKLGPGMMWEAVAQQTSHHTTLELDACVHAIHRQDYRVTRVEFNRAGQLEEISGTDFLSSMPLGELLKKLQPPPPPNVLSAADSLHHRDFITVALVVEEADLFPDNWIYVHDESVHVGRIQNFKNWSEHMVPDLSRSCVGLEYFCFEGDHLWNRSDDALVALASDELAALGLAPQEKISDGVVVRAPKAYPVYDEDYEQNLRVIQRFLNAFENLQVMGRNGLHRYNNQDHSMLTAMGAVANIFGAKWDLWTLNTDTQYLEEVRLGDPPKTTPTNI